MSGEGQELEFIKIIIHWKSTGFIYEKVYYLNINHFFHLKI
jgi:hypothetical protein